MKNLFTVLNNRFAYATMMTFMLAAENAHALDNSKFAQLLQDTKFQTPITVGFGVFTAFKWFDYFSNFNASSALMSALTPAVLTFLTFKWTDVLGWIGLM